jgi:hypothetical protein
MHVDKLRGFGVAGDVVDGEPLAGYRSNHNANSI